VAGLPFLRKFQLFILILGAGNRHVKVRGQVSELQACNGDDRAEIVEGSRDIRIEAGECLQKA
jgi:hypothetical protein